MKYLLILTALLTSCNILNPEPTYITSIVGLWCGEANEVKICYKFYEGDKVELEEEIYFTNKSGKLIHKTTRDRREHTYQLFGSGLITSTLWYNSFSTVHYSIVKNTLTLDIDGHLFTFNRQY